MRSKFCEQILQALDQPDRAGAFDIGSREIYHPRFKKKRIFVHENGARAETLVHWNYELQSDDRPGSKLVCFDENGAEISCDIENENTG